MSSIEDRIRAEIDAHPVVLFMKGTPQFPMCGFSSRSVQALKAAGESSWSPVLPAASGRRHPRPARRRARPWCCSAARWRRSIASTMR